MEIFRDAISEIDSDGEDCVREERTAYNKPEPFYVDTDKRARIYLGDALRLLGECKSGVFDLIFADPPYFLSNGGITCQAGKMVSVDKGEWDKSGSFADMHEFNLLWLRECKRVLKPTGTIFVSGTSHNIHSVGCPS